MKKLLFILCLVILNSFLFCRHQQRPTAHKLNGFTNQDSHSLTEVGVWGYGPPDFVFVDGNRAYINSGRYLIILDISDKTNPVKLGEMMLYGFTASIEVSGKYAYVANASGGLRIIDISNPAAMQEVGSLQASWPAWGIDVSGSYAYVSASTYGLRIIDVSDPGSPTEVGCCDTPGNANGVFVAGGYAYVGDESKGLRVIDVSNPNSPEEIGSYDTEGLAFYPNVRGNYLYLPDWYGGMVIIDISNPASPQKVAVIDTQSVAEEVVFIGNNAYVACHYGGVNVYDISNPASPQYVGNYDDSEFNAWGVDASGNYVYAANSQGLVILDISSPASPQKIGFYTTPERSQDVTVVGNYAYVANYLGGLRILDISRPSSPTEVGFYNTEGYAVGVAVSGNHAYVADGYRGLKIIDVSNPTSPQLTGSCVISDNKYVYSVHVSGTKAYVAAGDAGLRIIDISSPTSPQELGFYDTTGSARNVVVSGSHAYVADGDKGLRVIDVSNPAAATEVAYYDTTGYTRSVYLTDPYIYLADGENGLRIIDLPNEVGYFDTNSTCVCVHVSGNFAYVSDFREGLRVIDISTPGTPLEVAYFKDTLEFSNSIYISEDYIFVTNGYCGMTILKHETTPPAIDLNRTRLNFGHSMSGYTTGSQTVAISNSGGGTLNWSSEPDADWLSCTPTSGTGSGVVTVSVDPPGLGEGTYHGVISISDVTASNSPQSISIMLNVHGTGSPSPPFGEFSTPIHGSTVMSSVPVTGWVLDDIGVSSLRISREEGNSLVYIGDAIFVEGARPDVEQLYPGYPMSCQAGWGYMMLTNFLPNGGNGPFKIHAIATDIEGNEIILGTKTIYCDNASAVKPFGAIDTPTQGGTATGSAYRNQGWVLTPIPNSIHTDGSTISVYVDSINLGHPTYNIYRADIAGLFPGYANSNGAIAYFDFDTTTTTDGVHTIYWTASNNAGNTDGIGSRYFSIQNSHGAWSMESQAGYLNGGAKRKGTRRSSFEFLSKIPVDYSSPVGVLKRFNRNVKPFRSYPDENGNITIEIRELERIEIYLNDYQAEGNALVNEDISNNSKFKIQNSKFYSVYQVVGSQLRSLPIGSNLDRERGIFYWHPGPGYVGEYRLVFIKKRKNGEMAKNNIIIEITPKF